MQLEPWEEATKRAKAKGVDATVTPPPIPSLVPATAPTRLASPWKGIAIALALLFVFVSGLLTATLFRAGNTVPQLRPADHPPRTKGAGANGLAVPATAPPVAPLAAPDYTEWAPFKSLAWTGDRATCVAFSPDGRMLAVGGGTESESSLSPDGYGGQAQKGFLQAWETETWSPVFQVLEPLDLTRGVMFYPTGSSLAVADRRKTRIVDTRTGAVKFTILSGFYGAIALNPRKNILAVEPYVFWDSLTGEQKPCFVTTPGEPYMFSPDGALYYVGGRIFDLETGRLSHQIVQKGGVAAFSHDGKAIGSDKDFWLFEKELASWTYALPNPVRPTGIAFTPDDKFLLVADMRGGLSIVDVRRKAVARTFLPAKTLMGIALSADGSLLATIGGEANESVKIWKAGRHRGD